VIEAASELSELLESCPNLTLLVTSRELLRIRGEVEYAVPPLAEPEAVKLFCARAQIEPSDEIAELCARLDSLPLAVELAAARAKALTPSQILERLSGRLDVLKGGRDADPRQQTLRATIEWSYELLSPEEQELFARLSVFAGGCTLEAAEEVADADLDTLQSLVEKSLLRFSAERYWMLETIREYAGERLAVSTGGLEVVARCRDFYVALAEACGADAQSAREAEVNRRLEPEFANLRSTVAHALASRPDDVGRILDALFPFLLTRNHTLEARAWLDAALSERERLSEDGLVMLISGGGEIARFAGDDALAFALKHELLDLGRTSARAKRWRASTLADLCDMAMDAGDLESARAYAEQSVEASGGAGGRAALSLADLALRTGDLEAAVSHATQALEELEAGEYNHGCALEILGEAARRGANDAEAEALFRRGLLAFAALGAGGAAADCLDGMAQLARAHGDLVRTGCLRGAAEGLRQEWAWRRVRSDVDLPVGDQDAFARGGAMTLDEAVEYALASLD
jgi:tetratricopeptide (TPR) repeat protein